MNYPNGLIIDDSCNVFITGVDNHRAVTLKYDSSGARKWIQTYIGSNGGAQAYAIALDNNNNVFITGFTNGINTDFEYFTIKYSYTGVQQWEKRFNTDSTENSNDNEANSITIDYRGNIYISGFSRLNNSSSMKMCTLKYSNQGDLIWSRVDTNGLASQNTSMTIDLNSNIYITGSGIGTGYRTIKYNSSGIVLWTASYQTINDFPRDIKADRNGNVFVTGHGGTDILTIKYSQPVGIEPLSNSIPITFKLSQNFPNPFNPSTEIKFDLPQNSFVSIKIYNVLGEEVLSLVNNEYKNAGRNSVTFDGTNLASGVYFYTIKAGLYNDTKKMVFLK